MKLDTGNQYKIESIETPLGSMFVVADDHALHVLDFADRRGLKEDLERLKQNSAGTIMSGRTDITDQIEGELRAYFGGQASSFDTPLKIYGSDFQQAVMEELLQIPCGYTRSYKQQAENIKKPKAVRAVARANSMNQIAIVIPCHRVIGSDGRLTGYAGGLPRKEWLLAHEQSCFMKKPA